MPKSYDTRLIMMVAQESFEDKLNRFCKLIPIIYVDGTSASPDDFPNDGEIWWMLTARTAQLAEPGRLVVGTVEDAMRYDAHDLTSSRYQAQRESVRDLEIRDGMEVLELPGDAIDDIQDLVSRGYRHDVPHRPTGLVMLRWRSQVYGPFLASPDAHGGAEVSRAFSFAPANVDMKVYQVGREVFESMTKEYFTAQTMCRSRHSGGLRAISSRQLGTSCRWHAAMNDFWPRIRRNWFWSQSTGDSFASPNNV